MQGLLMHDPVDKARLYTHKNQISVREGTFFVKSKELYVQKWYRYVSGDF